MICNKWKECIHDVTEFSEKNVPCKMHKMDKGFCILSCDKRTRIVCSDHGKKYTLVNRGGTIAINYRMDGGIIKEDKSVPLGTKKCDNVIILPKGEMIAVLVELKGNDVRHAMHQLSDVLKEFSNVFCECGKIYARCATNRNIPNILAEPEYVKLKRSIGKKGNIKCVRTGTEEMVENL